MRTYSQGLNTGAKQSGATCHYLTSFDEGRPGTARRAGEGGRPSHTTNIKIVADMEFFRRFE